jgi:hypothetical protein
VSTDRIPYESFEPDLCHIPKDPGSGCSTSPCLGPRYRRWLDNYTFVDRRPFGLGNGQISSEHRRTFGLMQHMHRLGRRWRHGRSGSPFGFYFAHASRMVVSSGPEDVDSTKAFRCLGFIGRQDVATQPVRAQVRLQFSSHARSLLCFASPKPGG